MLSFFVIPEGKLLIIFHSVPYNLIMSKFYALRLYREILRKSRQLKLTDKEYFRRTVRKDFERYRHLEDKKEIEFQIKVDSIC